VDRLAGGPPQGERLTAGSTVWVAPIHDSGEDSGRHVCMAVDGACAVLSDEDLRPLPTVRRTPGGAWQRTAPGPSSPECGRAGRATPRRSSGPRRTRRHGLSLCLLIPCGCADNSPTSIDRRRGEPVMSSSSEYDPPLIQSGGGTGPMKPGNLGSSEGAKSWKDR
jgi:hypothetical protein